MKTGPALKCTATVNQNENRNLTCAEFPSRASEENNYPGGHEPDPAAKSPHPKTEGIDFGLPPGPPFQFTANPMFDSWDGNVIITAVGKPRREKSKSKSDPMLANFDAEATWAKREPAFEYFTSDNAQNPPGPSNSNPFPTPNPSMNTEQCLVLPFQVIKTVHSLSQMPHLIAKSFAVVLVLDMFANPNTGSPTQAPSRTPVLYRTTASPGAYWNGAPIYGALNNMNEMERRQANTTYGRSSYNDTIPDNPTGGDVFRWGQDRNLTNTGFGSAYSNNPNMALFPISMRPRTEHQTGTGDQMQYSQFSNSEEPISHSYHTTGPPQSPHYSSHNSSILLSTTQSSQGTFELPEEEPISPITIASSEASADIPMNSARRVQPSSTNSIRNATSSIQNEDYVSNNSTEDSMGYQMNGELGYRPNEMLLRRQSGGEQMIGQVQSRRYLPTEMLRNLQIGDNRERVPGQTNYGGDTNSEYYRAHTQGLDDSLNCSLWICGIPTTVTISQLFDLINTGAVSSLNLKGPDANHNLRAADLVFREPESAAAFIQQIAAGLSIGGLTLYARYNRNGIQRHTGPQSRVIFVEGPVEMMTFDRWKVYFDGFCGYQLDRYIESAVCNGKRPSNPASPESLVKLKPVSKPF
ncbi:hypothetical protein G7Y89_g6689 [Cudoniella acicularis]|uniref:RRM domain-containing protein n=1 Tax=Cudoniella acicularis TaxID=354080 RepID=A0A8H4W595_9HELO|nr:hypothetical protein G7Y89_g6689 [Cudoniella acicularis]